jgi:photosystem II stability/assembly factor-like uncharacterized protein
MMKKTLLFTLLMILGIALVLNFSPWKPRDTYEDYILKVYHDALKEMPEYNGEEELKAADEPDMAALQEFVKTVDPKLKYVPKKRLVKAYELTKQAMAERDYTPDISWEGTGANMGGRTRTIMYDPNDPDHKKVWAGGVTGGLWFNEDITNTNIDWEPVDDFWPDLAVSCMAYDPDNPDVIYVGTGEAQTARIIYRASSGLGNGIYKTEDGGISWEVLGSTSDFEYITDLVVREENGIGVIYAAVASGTYMGEDHESQPSDGLFRSDDGGQNWQQVLPDIDGLAVPYTPSDIEIASNGRIFVGTMENLNKKGGATVLYSDSGLPGSWTVYNNINELISNDVYYNIPARTIVACAPSNSNIIYAQFAAGYVNGFTYYRGRYMIKSDDGGSTWNQINHPSHDTWATLGWHAFILKVSPADPGKIFTGGLDLWNSSNNGYSWRHISDWSLMYSGGGDQYVHADQHKIIFKPGSSSSALFTSDGGIFMSNTANQNYPVFIQRNQGYNTLQFYTCCMNPTDGEEEYIGGLQDNGTLLYKGDPLEITDMISGGDGAYCFWDQNEPGVYITSVYYNQYIYWNNGSVVTYSTPSTGTFISPADYDYKENILYSNAVRFSGDLPNKLFRASGVPFVYGNEGNINIGTNSNVPFSHVKYSPYSPSGHSTLFVGTESGKVYKITNAESDSPSAYEITGSDFPLGSVSCIAIGSSENVLLVTLSNYGVSSVWLTMDGGLTWQEKEANLPDMPVRWAIFHPQNDAQVLLATETGVWATNTLTYDDCSWSPAVEGMANVRVDMLKLREADNVVLAATHGRGLFTCEFKLDIYDGVKDLVQENSRLKIYPVPAGEFVNIEFEMRTTETVRIIMTNVSGKVVMDWEFAGSQGLFNERLDVSRFPEGVYVMQVSSGNDSMSKKIVLR